MTPEAEKSVAILVAAAFAELTSNRVTTSLGLASIHVLMSPSQETRDPASSKEQSEWQRRSSVVEELTVWIWALSSLTPASSCVVLLKNWLPDDVNLLVSLDTNGLSCAPRWVMFP